MTDLTPVGRAPATFADVRWQCPRCGRFVAESSVQSEDRVDPSAYYGVTSRTWVTCSGCGEVDGPRLVVVGEMS